VPTITLSLLAILLTALVSVSAGARPIQGATGGKVCRTYSTDETRVSSGPAGKTGTLRIKCKYDTATNQYVCQENYSGSSSYSFVQTTQFASVADFVGDPSRVAFFSHAQTLTVKFPSSTSAQVYAYDSRGYLTSIASSSSTGGGTVQKFSAWDPFGRPTAGRDETQDIVLTYDDAQRVVTQKFSAAATVITLKLDANGNHASSTTVSPTFKDTTTITVHATEQLCK
jgi:YD repeat-containing protein